MQTPDPIAAACAAERERRGLTYKQLAERSGVAATRLSEWLAGKRSMTTRNAAKVMDALGLGVRRGRGGSGAAG